MRWWVLRAQLWVLLSHKGRQYPSSRTKLRSQRRMLKKELSLLMDTDKSGKIPKQEWMKFMEAEFDRLDKDKKGEIDQKELMQSRVWVKHETFQSLGK